VQDKFTGYICSIKQNNYFVSLSKNKRSPICRLLPVFVFCEMAANLVFNMFLHDYAEKRRKIAP